MEALGEDAGITAIGFNVTFIAVGLFLGMFGIRFLKPAVFCCVCGAIAYIALQTEWLRKSVSTDVTLYVLAAAAGLACGVVAVRLISLGLYIAGGFVGYVVCLSGKHLWSAAVSEALVPYVPVLGVGVGVLLVFLLEKKIMMALTSTGGAVLIYYGAEFLVKRVTDPPLDISALWYCNPTIFIVLSASFFMLQWKHRKKRPREMSSKGVGA